jgi:hypothetical protein
MYILLTSTIIIFGYLYSLLRVQSMYSREEFFGAGNGFLSSQVLEFFVLSILGIFLDSSGFQMILILYFLFL